MQLLRNDSRHNHETDIVSVHLVCLTRKDEISMGSEYRDVGGVGLLALRWGLTS